MICAYCDAEMPEISGFCPECGRAINSAASGEDGEAKAPSLRLALLGALAYVATVPAVVCLAIPRLRRDRFARFHCWQSVLFGLLTLLALVAMRLWFALLSLLPGIGFLLACLSVGIACLALMMLWLVLVVKAALGQTYQLPWIGRQAARLAQ